MSIMLPTGHPGADLLQKEGMTPLSESAVGETRVLRIGLVNLMPRKEATEIAFARLLAQSTHAVRLTFLVPASYQPRNVPAACLDRFFRRWPEVRDERFDGLIVTGAPVETLPFEEVAYWTEMRHLFDWARTSVGTTLCICWAAQAALHIFRDVPKHLLLEKTSHRPTMRPSRPLRWLGSQTWPSCL